MNEKIKQHLFAYNEKMKWKTDDPKWLYETLRECGKELYRDKGHSHRWWYEYFIVKEIDGMLIGFVNADTTGDESAEDKGWKFDEDSICEVKAVERTITVYEPIK
jgi:hypothetical protein